jgi:tRNA A-37 threonylcarbamoyl transferase component Bud32
MSDLITTFRTLQRARPSTAKRRARHRVESADVPTDVVAGLRQMELLASGDVPRVTALASSPAARVYRVDLGWGSLCVKRHVSHDPSDARALMAERVSAETAWLKVASGVVPGTAPAVLGAFPAGGVFAMEYLDGDDFASWQSRLAAGKVEPWVAAELGHLIGRLHAASANSAVVRERFVSLATFRALALAPRFDAAARARSDCEPRLAALAGGLGARRIALLHGALSPDNVLVGPRGPVLIDADCAHSGDAVFDAATCLAALALRMVGHSQLRPDLAETYDAFQRSYLAHVTWEMPEHAEARAAALIPALLLAGLAEGAADQRRASDVAHALLLDPPRRVDELCGRWLDALAQE